MCEFGNEDGIIFYYEGGRDESGGSDSGKAPEETILEEVSNDMVDDGVTINDIYAELITCRNRLTAISEYNSNIETRLQHIELYSSVSIGLMCFILGGFFGWLILGRIR